MLDASCGATFGFIFRRFSPLFREKCLTKLLLIIFIMLPLPLPLLVAVLLNTPPRNHISTPLRHRFSALALPLRPHLRLKVDSIILGFCYRGFGPFGFTKSTILATQEKKETLHNEHVSLTWLLPSTN